MKLAVIVNPAAGGGRAGRMLPSVREALTHHRLDFQVQRTDSLEHARELGLAAARSGQVAVAFGGDGLIAAVAQSVAQSDGVLGVLPGGRGNDFARGLGIPLDPRRACEVLAAGDPRPLDLGQVQSRMFVGIASCGFDSEANRIANGSRMVRGRMVYAYGALRALASWQPATFRIVLDGEHERTFTGYSVAAANSRAYGGGMFLAPEASLRDGLLDVVLISQMPRGRFLTLLPTVFSGRHVHQANVEVLRCRELEVSADRPMTMYADGDPIARLPATVGVCPSAVRVLMAR